MRLAAVKGCLGLSASLAALPASATPVEIGKAETVVPAVESDTAGTVLVLKPGSEVYQDDVVKTYKIGAANLRFLDQATLTVYPNSSVKLDKFVYDGGGGSTDVVINLTKGAFRFVSRGKGPEKYRLQTPNASIGIRGTVVNCMHDDVTQATTLIINSGEVSVQPTNSTKQLVLRSTDEKNAVRISKDGQIEFVKSPNDLGARSSEGSGSVPAGGSGPGRVSIQEVQFSVQESDFSFTSAPSVGMALIGEVEGFVGGGSRANPEPVSRDPACFLPGTLIETPSGERSIEHLKSGDKVIVQGGEAEPIWWIPQQAFSRQQGRWPMQLWPVCVTRHAFGHNRPSRDLYISQWHSIYLDGILIPAKLLCDGKSVFLTEPVGDRLEFLTIELHRHTTVRANGVHVETFRPARESERTQFGNYPQHAEQFKRAKAQTDSFAPYLKVGLINCLGVLQVAEKIMAAKHLERHRAAMLRESNSGRYVSGPAA